MSLSLPLSVVPLLPCTSSGSCLFFIHLQSCVSFTICISLPFFLHVCLDFSPVCRSLCLQLSVYLSLSFSHPSLGLRVFSLSLKCSSSLRPLRIAGCVLCVRFYCSLSIISSSSILFPYLCCLTFQPPFLARALLRLASIPMARLAGPEGGAAIALALVGGGALAVFLARRHAAQLTLAPVAHLPQGQHMFPSSLLCCSSFSLVSFFPSLLFLSLLSLSFSVG